MHRLVGLGEDDVVAGLIGNVFDAADNGAEKEVHHFRDDDPDSIGFFLSQAQGHDVRLVVEFFGQFVDGLFSFGANVGMVFEGARYRGRGDAQFAGDVFDGDLVEFHVVVGQVQWFCVGFIFSETIAVPFPLNFFDIIVKKEWRIRVFTLILI